MSIWALKGATLCNRATRSNYLTRTLLALCEARSSSCLLSPGHTRSCDLCALGLRIVKAAGLVQASCLLNFPRTPMIVYNHVIISFLGIPDDPVKGKSQFIGLIDDIIHHEGGGLWTDDVVDATVLEIETAFKAFAILIIVLC